MVHQLLGLIGNLPLAAARLLAWLAVAALIFIPLEHLLAGSKTRIPRRAWLSDLGYYFASGLIPAFLLLFTTTLINALGNAILPRWWIDAVAAWPTALAAALTLVIGDLAYYWAHRWSHEIPWLWRFHSVHHSPKQLYWLVNTRIHPIDAAYTRTLVFIPVCLLGLSQARAGEADTVVLGVVLLNRLWSTWVHANVRVRVRWLEGILSTPMFHHWHHANDGPQWANHNYAALLPIWDRIFGSRLSVDRFPQQYGLDS